MREAKERTVGCASPPCASPCQLASMDMKVAVVPTAQKTSPKRKSAPRPSHSSGLGPRPRTRLLRAYRGDD